LFSSGSPEEGARIYEAVLYAFDPTRRLTAAPKEVAELATSLRAEVPARRRARLMTKLPSLGKIPAYEGFRGGGEATLDRVGLLYSGDLAPAIRGLPGQNGGGDLEARLQARPALAELIRFAISEAHLELRAGLRLSAAEGRL